MNNREIKFRAWNGKYMLSPDYGDWISFDGVPYTEADQKYDTPHIEIQKAKDYILMQFTGLKDKNGKEIYEGDILRIQHKLGEERSLWYVDANYIVNTMDYQGLSLSYLKIHNDKQDSCCQIPIHQTLCFAHRSLCVDYRKMNYSNLAVEETYGENHMHRNRWIQNNYSNDIEIIGNQFENPELLK